MAEKASISAGLRGIADFRGREGRAQFWNYTLTIGFVIGTASVLVSGILMFRAFDGITFSEFGDFIIKVRDIFMQIRLWAVVVGFALVAAAVTRRLHDVGKSGRGALLPAGFTMAAVATLGRLFADLGQAGAIDGPSVDTPIDAVDDVVTQVDDLLGGGFDRIPRVWDASFLDLAFLACLSILAIVTAIPVLVQLVGASEVDENQYGPPPADPL